MLSIDRLSVQFPRNWELFFRSIFGTKKMQKRNIQMKCSVLFQLFCYILTNGWKKTPFHTAISPVVHTETKSKRLITLLNQFALCSSDDEVCWSLISPNLVILFPHLIQAAMDHFDWEGNTLSVVCGTHSTVLVVQNLPQYSQDDVNKETIVLSAEHGSGKRKHNSNELECQKLINPGCINKHYILPHDYPVHGDVANDDLFGNNRDQYFLWCLGRQTKLKSTIDESNIASDKLRWDLFPSFTAIVTALIDPEDIHFQKTLFGFTSMLPYHGTRHDTIYTCILNYWRTETKQSWLRSNMLWYGCVSCRQRVATTVSK